MNYGKQVRDALKKELGLTNRQVSVRSDYNSVSVTVKAPGVPFNKVREIANRVRRVRYCEASGEPLLGGNTYVNVSVSPDVVAAEIERLHLVDVLSAMDDGVLMDIPGTDTTLAYTKGCSTAVIWKGDTPTRVFVCGDPRYDSKSVAEALLML